MKTKIKTLLLTMTLFLTLSLGAFSQSYPTDVSLWGGYSWLNGVVGGEAQFGNFSVSAGYFPAKMPGDKTPVTSISWAVTYYGASNKTLNEGFGAGQACYYASIGSASAGYRYQASYGGGSWTDDIVEPMWIAMVGVKSYVNKWQFKVGGGYGWCDYANAFAWEVGLSYALFSNHSH